MQDKRTSGGLGLDRSGGLNNGLGSRGGSGRLDDGLGSSRGLCNRSGSLGGRSFNGRRLSSGSSSLSSRGLGGSSSRGGLGLPLEDGLELGLQVVKCVGS